MKSLIVAVICAKGNSLRLPNKNKRVILDKPLFMWGIEACLKSSSVDLVCVCTEDNELMANMPRNKRLIALKRPYELALHPWVSHSVEFVFDMLGLNADDIIVRVQANSPEVTDGLIDECVNMLITYKLWQVHTINSDGIENGGVVSFRAGLLKHSNQVAEYLGVVIHDMVDIHTEEDLQEAARRITARC